MKPRSREEVARKSEKRKKESDRDMSLRCRCRSMVASRSLHAVGIDAVEQHLQVGDADLHAVVRGLGEAKSTDFEAFVKQDVTVFVPVQQLDTIAASVL